MINLVYNLSGSPTKCRSTPTSLRDLIDSYSSRTALGLPYQATNLSSSMIGMEDGLMSTTTIMTRKEILLILPPMKRILSAITIEISATIQPMKMISLRENSAGLKVLMTMRRKIASKLQDCKKLQEICKYWLLIHWPVP